MKISIIVPVFNLEIYIKKCIQSILTQSFQDFEVIIIDDGSKDRSLSICNQLAKGDDRITVISQNNRGVSSARNRGLEVAVGKYVVFVDGDDYLEENFLFEMYRAIEYHSVDIALCGWYFVHKNDKKKAKVIKPVSLMNREKLFTGVFCRGGFEGYLWNKIFVLDTIKKNYITFNENIKIQEDLLFLCRYINCAESGYYVDKALYNYVQREDSALGVARNHLNVQKKIDHLNDIEKNYGELQLIIPEYYGSVRKTIRHVIINEYVSLCLFCVKLNKSSKYFWEYRKKIKDEFVGYLFDNRIGFLLRVYSVFIMMGWNVSSISWKLFSWLVIKKKTWRKMFRESN